jgi:hypothetical protein
MVRENPSFFCPAPEDWDHRGRADAPMLYNIFNSYWRKPGRLGEAPRLHDATTRSRKLTYHSTRPLKEVDLEKGRERHLNHIA